MHHFFKTLGIIVILLFMPILIAANQENALVFNVGNNEMVFNHSTIDSATINNPAKAGGSYGINLKLNKTATQNMLMLSKNNIGKKATITLNGKVISSAILQSQLGGEFLISGLTKEQADEIIKISQKP